MEKKELNLFKGDKKRLARALRVMIGVPARTICRTMKNKDIVDQLQ